MLTASAVLGVLLVKTHQASVRQLQQLAAHSLLEGARSAVPGSAAAAPELRWWELEADGRVLPRGTHGEPVDAGSQVLAAEARERGRPLLRAGPPWEPIRFAAPVVDGAVLVARLPPAASGVLLLAILGADVVIFTVFGAYLLRARLVLPLQRLVLAARTIAAGDFGARVAADGPRETWELAKAFNEMGEALEGRTRALEKAVAELRQSNRSLRSARAGLDRAERLAAVGSLAAGVAHEVGNPMGALLTFVDLAKRDPSLSGQSRSHLERAIQEGERVRVILRQLLDFSRPRGGERKPVDLLGLCEETAQLVRAQRRYRGVEIEVVRDGAPPRALADRNAVAQILLNLLLNAADALSGGTPEPRVRMVVRGAAARLRSGEGAEAARRRRELDAVECVVTDNGPGIPERDRERIFDPFFTTKAPGEGTGLGLSNALRLAEEIGGTLELEAAREGGETTFLLRLPAALEPAAAGSAADCGDVRPQ